MWFCVFVCGGSAAAAELDVCLLIGGGGGMVPVQMDASL